MQEGTSKLLNTYYFIVDQIVKWFGEEKKKDKLRLHIAFKAFHRHKYGTSHTSLKDFTKEELNLLINDILIEFSVEYGVYLIQPHDPDNAEIISLREYNEYKNWCMESKYNLFNGIKELPEGFVLIRDIETLKTLKKGKRKKTPENMIWKYGTILYTYSPRENMYYKKILSTYTPIKKLKEYLEKNLLYGTNE